MAYLVLMLHCLVMLAFHKLLSFYAVTAYVGKSSNTLLFISDYFRNLSFVTLVLLRLDDVERNSGPKKPSVIKFRHWKLNVLVAHNFLKVPLIESFITTHHLNEHTFRNSFKDTVDPMCKCGREIETKFHFLLRCRLYSAIRTELLGDICTVASSLTNFPEEKLSCKDILLYGSEYFSVKTSQSVLKSLIKFLKSYERFDDSLCVQKHRWLFIGDTNHK